MLGLDDLPHGEPLPAIYTQLEDKLMPLLYIPMASKCSTFVAIAGLMPLSAKVESFLRLIIVATDTILKLEVNNIFKSQYAEHFVSKIFAMLTANVLSITCSLTGSSITFSTTE